MSGLRISRSLNGDKSRTMVCDKFDPDRIGMITITQVGQVAGSRVVRVLVNLPGYAAGCSLLLTVGSKFDVFETTVTIDSIHPNSVRLVFEGPAENVIWRREVFRFV